MLHVGLTGGIASGKSTVGEMFVELGCHLLDSDQITYKLFESGQDVHAAVVQAFGPGVIAPGGSIDRNVLGEIVFNDPAARKKLNSLVHPAIIQTQQEWLEKLEVTDPQGIGIVSAALMIEVNTYRNYSKLIVVSCHPDVQRRRLAERSGLSKEQIETRIAAQMPTHEKAKFADYVIDNSRDLEYTRLQVEDVNSKLRELAASTSGNSH